MRRGIGLLALTGFVLGLSVTITAFATCDDGLLTTFVHAFEPYHQQCNPIEEGAQRISILRTVFLTFIVVLAVVALYRLALYRRMTEPDSPELILRGGDEMMFRPPGMKPFDPLLVAFRGGTVQHGSRDA